MSITKYFNFNILATQIIAEEKERKKESMYIYICICVHVCLKNKTEKTLTSADRGMTLITVAPGLTSYMDCFK